jgi:hypothetical protein
MGRFGRRGVLSLAALVSFGAVALLPGCDWLTGSDNVQRTSPFLSGLRISAAAVLCGESHQYSVSFSYDDPQGDIARATIRRRFTGETASPDEIVLIEDAEPWPDDMNQNVGTVEFFYSFPCGSPGGRYEVTVEAEDDKGHKSNVLSGAINLTSAG